MGVLGALTDMQRLNFLGEQQGVKSIKGLFDTIRQRDLGQKFFTHGDYSPEGLQRFAQENKLSPQELQGFLTMAKQFVDMNRDKIRFDREGQRFELLKRQDERQQKQFEQGQELYGVKKKAMDSVLGKLAAGQQLGEADRQLYEASGAGNLSSVPTKVEKTMQAIQLQNAKNRGKAINLQIRDLTRKMKGEMNPVERAKHEAEMELLDVKKKIANAQLAKLQGESLGPKEMSSLITSVAKAYDVEFPTDVTGKRAEGAPSFESYFKNTTGYSVGSQKPVASVDDYAKKAAEYSGPDLDSFYQKVEQIHGADFASMVKANRNKYLSKEQKQAQEQLEKIKARVKKPKKKKEKKLAKYDTVLSRFWDRINQNVLQNKIQSMGPNYPYKHIPPAR